MKIRDAQISDIPKMSEMQQGAFATRGYRAPERGREEWLRVLPTFFVVEKNGEVVGMMSATFAERNSADHLFRRQMKVVRAIHQRVLYCGDFAVDKTLRSERGFALVGVQLVREAVARGWASDANCGVIIVNPCHLVFYEGLGFEQLARRKKIPELNLREGEKIPGVLMVITREKLRGRLAERAIVGNRPTESARV
ncbi:hypothetical protein KGM48_02590 [Patescibacteria group bacterium]|nr:hypothetical protein [Patescibacteria group bacterium]